MVDNGSEVPLTPRMLEQFGPEFRLVKAPDPTVSPAPALNLGIRESRAELVGVIVDGARMCSPGVLAGVHRAVGIGTTAFVTVLGWHLGSSMPVSSQTHRRMPSVMER